LCNFLLFGFARHALIIRSRFQHDLACALGPESFCEDAALFGAHATSSAFRDRDRWQHKSQKPFLAIRISQANREEIQWRRGGGKMAVSTGGDNFSVFSVAPVFFFVPVGEVSKRFGHVQKPGLVHGVLHALGKANAFRGVSTVIDN
jgi:hypothetical protein